MSKLKEDDVCKFFKDYDVICLCETWITDNSDHSSIPIPGYKFSMYNRARKSLYGRPSGGILVYYSQNLAKVFQIKTGCSELVDFYIGDCRFVFTYIAPEDSTYQLKNRDTLKKLETMVTTNNVSKFFLMGDMNGRTGTSCDDCDDANLPQRLSTDKIINARGRSIIELCRTNNLCITNGRKQDTSGPTYISRVGKSVIDYLITHVNCLPLIKDMRIHDRAESDHLPISFSVPVQYGRVRPTRKPPEKTREKYIWNDAYKEEYQSKLRECLSLPVPLLEPDEPDVTKTVRYLQETILDSAKSMKVIRRHNQYRSNSRPRESWYDSECQSRKKVATSSLTNVINKTRNNCCSQEDLVLYSQNRRDYKRLVRQKKRAFHKAQLEQLLAQQKRDPRAWWRQIGWKGKTNDIKVPKTSLQRHFKKLLEFPDSNVNKRWEAETEAQLKNWLCSQLVTDQILDTEISQLEIQHAVNKLKLGKAAGIDNITTELVKNGYNSLSTFLRDLYNKIYDTATFPSDWQRQILHTIYKKGDQLNPGNYRGLALISVFSKPFLNILHCRIQAFCENRNLLIPEQGGFRPGRQTTDNVYALHCRISCALSKNAVLYCVFIDYSKCFDTISRVFLWSKLVAMGFSTKTIKMLMAIYSNVEFTLNDNLSYGDESMVNCDRNEDMSEVEEDNWTFEPIKSTIGLKQGCPLSPILFSCFSNDAVKALKKGLRPEEINDISVLLFADDMVMFSESPDTIRSMIRNLEDYTDTWGLSVNLAKTQIVAFRNPRRRLPKEDFRFKGGNIDLVDSYKYLGVNLHYSGKWKLQLNDSKIKGTGSLFKLRDKMDKFPQMPVSDLIRLYQSCVQSGLLFGAEIWGTANIDIIETVQCSFAKYALGVRKQTPNVGAISELGLLPYKKYVNYLILKYWLRIVLDKPPIIFDAYIQLRRIKSDRRNKPKTWCHYVENILNSLGFPIVWLNQGVAQKELFLRELLSRIRDVHTQEFDTVCSTSPRLSVLSTLRSNPCRISLYLKCPVSIRKAIAKLRLSSHNLCIETGRWTKPKITPRESRFCHTCKNVVEDEFHFMSKCPLYDSLRRLYVPYYSNSTPEIFLLDTLGSENLVVLRKIGIFVLRASKLRDAMT